MSYPGWDDLLCCSGRLLPADVEAFLFTNAQCDTAERGSAAFHAGLCFELCAAAISGASGEKGRGQEHLLQDIYMGWQEVMLSAIIKPRHETLPIPTMTTAGV